MMRYRLGLDVGTSSVGAIALALDDNEQPIEIAWDRVHIFSETVAKNNKGTFEAKGKKWREARLARRQRYRRRRITDRILHLAPLLGLSRDAVPELNRHLSHAKTKLPELHVLRARAIDQKITLEEMLAVFLSLSKRRGYAGGFRAKSDGSETGSVETGAATLKKEMANLSLGQYKLERILQGLPGKLKTVDYPDLENLYALREQVEEEFRLIWTEQSKHHRVLNDSAYSSFHDEERPLQDIFRHAIFYQRPLKSVASMVGNCPLETDLPRAPKAQISSQAFRLEKQMNDLRWAKPEHNMLTAEQKELLRELLCNQATISFEAIYSKLNSASLLPDAGQFRDGVVRFTIDRFSRKELKGDTTNAGFKTLKLDTDWRGLSSNSQIQVINLLADMGSPESFNDARWYEKVAKEKSTSGKASYRTFKPEVVTFIDKMLETGKFERLSNMTHFESGRAAYSIKAMRKLTAYMIAENVDEFTAIDVLYPEDEETFLTDKLTKHKPTGNSIVDVALNEVRYVINDCIDTLGVGPHEVVVEMSREMKQGLKDRNATEEKQNENRQARADARKKLEESGYPANNNNMSRYLMWQEQDHHCPYCNKTIGLHEVVDGLSTDYEHIIPKSLSQIGKKRSELILSHRSCNDDKGDQLPLVAFSNDPDRVAAIKSMAKSLKKKHLTRKGTLLEMVSPDEMMSDSTVSGFSESQNHDTSWVAKLVAQWVLSLKSQPSVWVTRGRLTSRLRYKWGLETVIAEARLASGLAVLDRTNRPISQDEFRKLKKYWEGHGHTWTGDKELPQINKRIDHRHHLVDALVIALTSRKVMQAVSRSYAQLCDDAIRKSSSGGIDGRMRLKLLDSAMLGKAEQLPKLRDQALSLIKACNLTHKPDRFLTGEMFEGKAYRKVPDPEDESKTRLVVRAKLTELAGKNPEITLKKLKRIVSITTREIVTQAFNNRISKGVGSKEALKEPIYQSRYGRPVRINRVRIYLVSGTGFRNGDTASAIPISKKGLSSDEIAGGSFKYLLSAANAFHQLTSTESRTVSLREALAMPPKAEDERRFFKGDHLLNVATQEKFYVSRITANSIFLVKDTESYNYDEGLKLKTRGTLKMSAPKKMRDLKVINV
jgi:CRISPR-associated endonuclease Csn1